MAIKKHKDGKPDWNSWLEINKVTDPEHPHQFYDYRAAYEADEYVDEYGHWPSKYKHDLHPNRYIRQEDGTILDTKHNRQATEEDVTMQQFDRQQYLDNWEQNFNWYNKSTM